MKKFFISTIVILMSVSAFAQTQINKDKALEALFAAAPTTVAITQDGSTGLETILAPLKNDLADLIATGVSLGDDGGSSKSLRQAGMQCESLSLAHAKCTLSMERTSGVGTTIDFRVVISADGSMTLIGPVTAESDM